MPVKLIAAFGTVTFVCGIAGGVAVAGSAFSDYGFFSVAGREYRNQAGVHTDHANDHSAHASTHIVHLGGNLPAGYMGTLPMLRDSAGGLLCQGTYVYTSTTSSGLGSNGCFRYIHSAFSSKGVTRAWNGSGYNSVWTALSPNQNS